MKKNRKFALTVIVFLLFISYFLLKMNEIEKQLLRQKDRDSLLVMANKSYDDARAIQKAIDEAASSKVGQVTLPAHQTYNLKSGIVVKEGVQLVLNTGTKIKVAGDFKAIVLEKDSSLINGMIEVVDPSFSSAVIYVRGNEFYDSMNETRVENVKIVNSTGDYSGTGLSFYSKGPWHNISFVNVMQVTIKGFKTGIKLQAEPPEEEGTYSWVNANRFVDLSMEDCVSFIEIIGSVTIPSECSGNFFTGLQIQLTEKTKKIVSVDGSYNKFEGMIWDQQRIEHQGPLIYFSSQTAHNTAEMNINSIRLNDQGVENKLNSR